MQGYSPNLETNANSEFVTKKRYAFIELGVNSVQCKEDCDCEDDRCKELDNK